MSFSFRKLFKKSEQDSGVERTRLQFVRPQGQALSPDDDRSSPVIDSGDPGGSAVLESPFSRLDLQSMNQKETGAAPLSSPFEIADPLPAKPEVDDAFSSQAVKQPVHLSSPEDAMNREGDTVAEGTNGRLFGLL